jgi:hypothetical protein
MGRSHHARTVESYRCRIVFIRHGISERAQGRASRGPHGPAHSASRRRLGVHQTAAVFGSRAAKGYSLATGHKSAHSRCGVSGQRECSRRLPGGGETPRRGLRCGGGDDGDHGALASLQFCSSHRQPIVSRRPARSAARRQPITPVPRHTTVPPQLPPFEPRPSKPPRRASVPRPAPRQARWGRTSAPRSTLPIIDQDEATVLDVIDNLLNKGVLLNADLTLALADVDLVYIRLSALLCAADRVLRRHS